MQPLMLFGGYAVILFLAIYLFVYIPNKKKNKQVREMHDSLAVGDVVVAIGRLVARVKEKSGDYVILIVDEEKDISVKMLLMAVSQIKEKSGAED